MGIALLISVVVLACLAGWIAHAVEKSLRNRQLPREARKPVSTYQQPTETVYSIQKSSPVEQDSVTPPQQTKVVQPSRLKIEPTGIESRFDDWQGAGEEKYPPDWKFRSAETRKRDGDSCQVAGCPSFGLKHVHHLDSIKNGGSHVLSNLITLCEFHHALMPDHLEAIGESLENNRFSVVPAFIRHNSVSPGYHIVKAHIQRRRKASQQDIQLMLRSFECSCLNCHNDGFECSAREKGAWAEFSQNGNSISCDWRLVCQQNGCGHAWYFQGGLHEEVSLVLARRVFRRSSHPKLAEYENAWLEDFDFIEAPACRRADCLGHLLWRRNRNDGSHFLGCSEYFETGCKGR